MPLMIPFGVLGSVKYGAPYYWLPNYGTGYASHNTSLEGPTYFSTYGSFVKLDGTGKILFGKNVPGGKGIHQDSFGNTYVTRSQNAGTVKFDSSGNVVWAKALFQQGASLSDMEASDSAVDSQGNAYFALHPSYNSNNNESVVLKLRSNGGPGWLRTSSSAYTTYAISVSPDDQYVAMGLGINNTTAAISVFRTSDLAPQWERRFTVSGGTLHNFSDLDWDSNNNVYAVGWYRVGSSPAIPWIYATKLDVNGNFQWKTGAVAKSGPYGLPGIAVDGNDDIYVSEYEGGLAKFDSSGNVVFGRSFDAPAFLRMTASKIDDTISIMGFSSLNLKGDGSGTGTYSDGSNTLTYSNSSVDTSESVSYGGSINLGWTEQGFGITNLSDSITDITQPDIVYLEG